MNLKVYFILCFVLSVLSPYVIKYVVKIYQRSSRKILKDLNHNQRIATCLHEVMTAVNASRVAIILYEGRTASMKHEVAANNPIISVFQGILTSPLADMLIPLEQYGEVLVNKSSNTDLIRVHKAIGIETSYKFKIHDSIAEGVLVVAFEQHKELTPDQLQFIKTQLTTLRLLYK
jgi:hypothetical protein